MLRFKYFIVLFFISFNVAFSQPCDGPNCGQDADTPITGIEILIALGSMFGVKRVFDIRKKSKPS